MRPWSGAGLVLALAACMPTAPLPAKPVPADGRIAVQAAPVALGAEDRIGDFRYAGGVHLTSSDTSRLHGMSDLKVWPDGRVLMQGDQADVFEARLVLDGAGRLVGVRDARISALKGPDGADLYAGGERERDSEGVAEFANGDRLVSFEQHDRILLYPRGRGPPREAPIPPGPIVFNQGMESLAADPAAGPDAYRVGLEATGQTFACRLSSGCRPAARVAQSGGQDLVALDVLPGGRTAYLLRGFTALRGNFVRLRIVDAAGQTLGELNLERPQTVDNFEGVAAVPRPGGVVRFYLISDDNFGTFRGLPTDQRTLLMAFDWTPPTGRLR